ncbi:RNA polymerase sigma factor [Streptomyces sp. NPDC001530]|uniref:RNA polymerase sigma factor n=1 Tax=Streptomyces sp. NPDC001530 TaxID=3364582 RepID=UPI00368D0508
MAELWDREAEGLRKYTTVITNNAAEAGDLVQRAFEAAALSWDKVGQRGPEEQRAWLRRACRNMWIDSVRRSKRLGELRPDLAERYHRTEPDPASLVLTRAAVDHCLRVINGFPKARRRVALLYFLEEHSALMIAELLGITASGVRVHVSKARRQLREELAEFVASPNEQRTALGEEARA